MLAARHFRVDFFNSAASAVLGGEGDQHGRTGGHKLPGGRHGKDQWFSSYHKLLAFSN